VTTTSVAERLEPFVAAFEAHQRAAASEPEWLRLSRALAFQRFTDRGFPSTREEEWRFTNVAPIAATTFVRPVPVSVDRGAVAPYLIPGGACQIVFVNGRISKSLSSLDAIPEGVTLRTEPSALPAADVSRGAGRPAVTVFGDLNEALFEDAVVLEIAPKAIVSTPIHVLSFVTAGTPWMVFPRLFLHVGESAQVSIIESFAGAEGGTSFTSAVTHFALGPNAVVDHTKLQRENATAFHLATFTVHQDRSSTLTSRAFTMGGRIARNDIVVTLDGEGAECTLHGLYVAGGESLVDTHTTIDHAKPHCPSHEIYKGILAGHARAVFNGKIIVRQDAQKTDAKQTNKALLLTDNAQVNTKPQLEIFADDVKCTHGAAIGQLDEDALFYLRARGIAEPDAKHMLIEAFAGQVLDGVTVPAVRAWAETLMERTLQPQA
jgi:Fe-S cluster assembly protein SufD